MALAETTMRPEITNEACTCRGTNAVASLPAGATAVALVRGPRPRGLWAWLWDRVGLRLARRAGWTVAAGNRDWPPEHVRCRCAIPEIR
jgi:hypothetical protein